MSNEESIIIIHTADWHLRDSQYCSPSRGEDFTKAALAVVDLAMAYGAKAICNCGDILNNRRPSSRNIKDLSEIDRRLRAAGIPMYVISGNHDFARPSWIDLLYEQTRVDPAVANDVGIIHADDRLLNIPGTGLTVYGAPSMGVKAFRETCADWPEADILMSHEPLKAFAAFPMDDDSLDVEDYPTEKYQAVLLGDLHARKYLNDSTGQKTIGYPGSIELCSNNEPPEKTISLFRFGADGKLLLNADDPSFVPVPSRKALFYRIVSDDQADQALADMHKYIDKDPIVLVRYLNTMHKIPSMFMTSLAGTNAILRCASFSDVQAGRLLGRNRDENLEHVKQPKDFVSDFISPGSDLHKLATALADPEVDHRQLITDYVYERMETDESNEFEDPGLRAAQIA